MRIVLQHIKSLMEEDALLDVVQDLVEELSKLLEETTTRNHTDENGDLTDNEKDYDLLPKSHREHAPQRGAAGDQPTTSNRERGRDEDGGRETEKGIRASDLGKRNAQIRLETYQRKLPVTKIVITTYLGHVEAVYLYLSTWLNPQR
ncbi:hypothetical protein RJT34_02643 [Clitoria ternatea]|uniref:Uncharacterized protein n=1 Tax=Clitoria ternatea TaxID=43366 RepID=A0AAN9KJB8_CLITE